MCKTLLRYHIFLLYFVHSLWQQFHPKQRAKDRWIFHILRRIPCRQNYPLPALTVVAVKLVTVMLLALNVPLERFHDTFPGVSVSVPVLIRAALMMPFKTAASSFPVMSRMDVNVPLYPVVEIKRPSRLIFRIFRAVVVSAVPLRFVNSAAYHFSISLHGITSAKTP